MTAPFLKKAEQGYHVRLAKAFYPAEAIDRFRAAYADRVFGVQEEGRYVRVGIRAQGEEEALEAVNHLFYCSRRR